MCIYKGTKYDPLKIEASVIKYWKKNDVYRKVRKNKGKKFFLLDGPPYANARPHIGHMQGKTAKDVMLRFKTMTGHKVFDQPGFDTHGLPIEVMTEEELGFTSKSDIEKYGVQKFVERCKKRALTAEKDWIKTMTRWAVWQDFSNPYLTFHKSYIESVWWLIARAHSKKLLYKALKPVHWCPRCETSLAGYEITDEYRDIKDYSIYVKFPVEGRKNTFLLVWTTTPWTIPANLTVLVNPDYEYSFVKVSAKVKAGGGSKGGTPEKKGKETLIIAKELVSRVMDAAKIKKYKIENTIPGTELQGLKYTHVLEKEVPEQKKLGEKQNVHSVLLAEELVTLDAGTGLVHAATGHGEEDYEVTRKYNLPVFSPVDSQGRFDQGKYKGKSVFNANLLIIEDLNKKGYLFHMEEITHEYPHCWRCKTKLIQRATEQWFLRIEPIKNTMLRENERIKWIPKWAKERFRNWLENARDWCISRQRYWGTPLPIWVCECGKIEVLPSFKALEKRVGKLPKDFDPHVHHVNPLEWKCSCGSKFKRVRDVADVWLDSGTCSFSSLHYPFNKEAEKLLPADYITESSDQIRGWFYTLLVCSIIAFGKTTFKKVAFQQHVLDAEGRKMSKSLGNVISPEEVTRKFGADLNRFYLLRVAKIWEHKKFDTKEVNSEIYRLFSVYWNSVQFMKEYLIPCGLKYDRTKIEDRWLISRINTLVKNAKRYYEDCLYHKLTREIEEFILNDLSRFYIKLVRERVKKGDETAIATMKYTVSKLNLILAPITPFITEALRFEPDSVHMQEFPPMDKELINQELEENMLLLKQIAEDVNSIRQSENVNLRWPLKRVVISVSKANENKLKLFSGVLANLVNVKNVEFGKVETTFEIAPNYKKIGPKFAKDTSHIVKLISNMNQKQIEELMNAGKISIDGYLLEKEDVFIKRKAAGNIRGRDFLDGKVFLDTKLDSKLKEEALIRELIHNIQQKRKSAGLKLTDKIALTLEGDPELLKRWRSAIKERVSIRAIKIGSVTKGSDNTGKVALFEKAIKFRFKS